MHTLLVSRVREDYIANDSNFRTRIHVRSEQRYVVGIGDVGKICM